MYGVSIIDGIPRGILGPAMLYVQITEYGCVTHRTSPSWDIVMDIRKAGGNFQEAIAKSALSASCREVKLVHVMLKHIGHAARRRPAIRSSTSAAVKSSELLFSRYRDHPLRASTSDETSGWPMTTVAPPMCAYGVPCRWTRWTFRIANGR